MSRLARLIKVVRVGTCRRRSFWHGWAAEALVLLVIVFLWGCVEAEQKAGVVQVKEVSLTPVEQRKAELLERIERRFERPDAHFELGKLYQIDGLWDKAEYEYNIVLRFVPGHHEAQAALVKLLLQRGDETKANQCAEMYMKQVGDSARNSLVLGHEFQKQGLDEYAHRCYQQALQQAPNSARIHKQIGYYYLSRNDKDRALEYLKRSFQLDPYQPEVAGELGRLGVVVKIPQNPQTDTEKLGEP
jgi:tetratricopeptide (TPR) repeat protein